MGKDFKKQMNIKSLYNQFFISAAIELPKDPNFLRSSWCGPGGTSKSFKQNNNHQTEKNFLFFNFINNAQAKNSQAKRGALINFFYN